MSNEKFVSLKVFPDAGRRRDGRFYSGAGLCKEVKAGSSGFGRNSAVQKVTLQ